MLNDYRIFDYRIKCLFSFSFVAHSILGFWKYRARVIVKERMVQAKVDRSGGRLFLATGCDAAQVCFPSHSPYVQCQTALLTRGRQARGRHARHSDGLSTATAVHSIVRGRLDWVLGI